MAAARRTSSVCLHQLGAGLRENITAGSSRWTGLGSVGVAALRREPVCGSRWVTRHRAPLWWMQVQCYSARPHGHDKAKDLYAIMGISPHATQQQIKEAYYKLSMKYHPDRNKGSVVAHEKFTELTDAYSVLGQYSLRKKYDKGLLHQYPQRPHPHHRHEGPRKTTFHGEKVKFDFDEFYRVHYGEALRREQQARRERKVAAERAQLKTVSDSSQRLLIALVCVSVFLVGWYGVRRTRTRVAHTGN